MSVFFKVRGNIIQRIRFSIATLADGLTGVLTLGFYGSSFKMEHTRKQVFRDIVKAKKLRELMK